MCRGFQQKERAERLRFIKIKAFYVRLSFCSKTSSLLLYDSLTLHFLPRINGGSLEIDGLNLRPDTPGFITLHRIVSGDTILYGSRERMVVSEGSRFEVYGSDVKVLKGTFRKDEEEEDPGEKWKLDCRCQLELGDDEFLREAEVGVEVEGQVGLMSEKVEMAVGMRRRRKRCFEGWLEEIPEEREFETEGCCCCSCSCSDFDDGKEGVVMEEKEGGESWEVAEEMDRVQRWAVDVGIWVMCLGVGYLVSKASLMRITKQQRRLFSAKP